MGRLDLIRGRHEEMKRARRRAAGELLRRIDAARMLEALLRTAENAGYVARTRGKA